MVKSTPPNEPSIVTACRGLYTAIDNLDEIAAQHLGILRSDLRCLNLLEHGAVTPTYIAQTLGLTSGSVTALIDRLESKGLVERVRDLKDRRSVYINGTSLLFSELGPIYKTVAKKLTCTVASYPPDEQVLAIRHLEDVTNAYKTAISQLNQPNP